MKSVSIERLLVASLIFGVAACEDVPRPRTAAPPVTAPESLAPTPPAEPAAIKTPETTPSVPSKPLIGMEDPFKLMNTGGARTLNQAWTAARRKEYAEARTGFAAVVAAYPDKPAARFAELRMAVLTGDLEAVPAMWKELLARDYLGYARRLDRDKEMAPLRRSPQWSRIQAITAEMKQAYLQGFGQGAFFVARIRDAGRPEFAPDLDGRGSLAKLDLDQEAYHLDPDGGRIRRVSDSGGRVLAIHHDEERRHLMMLTAGKLKKAEGKLTFERPGATVLSLETLEQLGPLPIEGDAAAVELCVSSQGEPLWVTTSAGKPPRTITFDATGTALVGAEQGCGSDLAITQVRPSGVTHLRPSPEGVALSGDQLQLTGVDEELPVRATSAIRPGSFGWSPGKKRFIYMDGAEVNRCQAVGPEPEALPSALYVWDGGRKRSRRLRIGPVAFAAKWLDDDRVVYEVGKGLMKKLTIHDLAGGPVLTLETPAGVGLFGLPAINCAEGEHHALVM